MLPTMDDRADLNLSDATIIVDDLYPNALKQANEVRIGWGTNNPDTTHKNVTLLITNAEDGGPGGVLTTNQMRISARGGVNNKLQVDAGHVIINGRLRTGRDRNATAFIEINGGRLDCATMELTELAGNYTEAGLTINGGELNVAGQLNTSGLPGKSYMHLNGGSARIGSLAVLSTSTVTRTTRSIRCM